MADPCSHILDVVVVRGRGHILHVRREDCGVGGRTLGLPALDPVREEDVGVGEVGGERGQRPS